MNTIALYWLLKIIAVVGLLVVAEGIRRAFADKQGNPYLKGLIVVVVLFATIAIASAI